MLASAFDFLGVGFEPGVHFSEFDLRELGGFLEHLHKVGDFEVFHREADVAGLVFIGIAGHEGFSGAVHDTKVRDAGVLASEFGEDV